MALEICITTDPVSKKWIPCLTGSTLDNQSFGEQAMLPAGTPYLTKSDKVSGNDSETLRLFEMLKQVPSAERKDIARLNKDFGAEVVDALAEFYKLQLSPAIQSVNNFTQNTAIPYLKKEMAGYAGAAATAVESRLKGFSGYVAKYQLALEQYRAAYARKANAAEHRALAKEVSTAQADVNKHFQGEIKRIMATNAAKTGSRGTVWTNPERAMGLAHGSKTDTAIKLQSSHNFKRVQQFQRSSNLLGKGVGYSVSAAGTYYFYVLDFKDGSGHLSYSRLIDGKYEIPVKMNAAINSGKYIAHPFIAPDESYLMWDAEKDGESTPDIYISFREKDGTWGEAINMGDKINTPLYEQRPKVTPDGKYLFFWQGDVKVREDGGRYVVGEPYWVDAKIIEELRPARE